MVKDASDTEDERTTSEPGTTDKLQEANIQMTARQVLNTCKGIMIVDSTPLIYLHSIALLANAW